MESIIHVAPVVAIPSQCNLHRSHGTACRRAEEYHTCLDQAFPTPLPLPLLLPPLPIPLPLLLPLCFSLSLSLSPCPAPALQSTCHTEALPNKQPAFAQPGSHPATPAPSAAKTIPRLRPHVRTHARTHRLYQSACAPPSLAFYFAFSSPPQPDFAPNTLSTQLRDIVNVEISSQVLRYKSLTMGIVAFLAAVVALAVVAAGQGT